MTDRRFLVYVREQSFDFEVAPYALGYRWRVYMALETGLPLNEARHYAGNAARHIDDFRTHVCIWPVTP